MADPKNYISQIQLGSTLYDIKDLEARADIETLQTLVSGGISFVGETSTTLTDGATTAVIVVNSENVTAAKGMLAVYGNKEFVFDGSKWIEMGDLSLIGDLGWKNSATGSYTPAGTVSQPTFSGSELTSTGNFTPAGGVAISVGSGDANYTPAGTVSQPSFSGNEMTSTGNFTPAGSVAVTVGAGEANYTPAGSVSKPNVTVTPTTDSVYSITDVGTLPTLSTTVANEVLTIAFTQGTLPTKGSAQTVLTGASAALDNAPVFSGTGVELAASFTGTQGAVSVAGTPTGTVSTPTFTGTGADLEATFNGTQGSVSVTGTPAGTVSTPTFTGTAATITVS